MEKNILVAYASKYGATREIAEKIGEVLRQAGLPVDVQPVESCQDITPYKAVILGSALYVGSWQKGAVKFLQDQEKLLAARPVWLFSSGPSGEGDPVVLIEGPKLPAALQPVVDRIQPRDIAVFHGNINPQKVNFIEKFLVKNVVKKPMGDFRDWNMIAAWASKVAAELKSLEIAR